MRRQMIVLGVALVLSLAVALVSCDEENSDWPLVGPESFPDLSIEKSVNDPGVIEGQEVIYTIEVSNISKYLATEIEVMDTLAVGVTLKPGSADPSTGAYDEATGVWTIQRLEAGGTAILYLTATVDQGTSLQEITNYARIVNLKQNETNTSNNIDSVTIVPNGSDLSLSKAVDDNTPNVGDLITYTLRVTNLGPADALDVLVSDVLPDEVAFHSYSTTPPSLSYDEGTGIWDAKNISNGSTVELRLRGTVVSGTSDTPIPNCAEITQSSPLDPDPDNMMHVPISRSTACRRSQQERRRHLPVQSIAPARRRRRSRRSLPMPTIKPWMSTRLRSGSEEGAAVRRNMPLWRIWGTGMCLA